MCGLAGYSMCKVPSRELVAGLMVASEKRGTHSWGMFFPETDEIQKDVGRILPHLDLTEGKYAAMLHTRFATTGAKTKENAHPWRIGSLVGAHNGIVFNHKQLNLLHNRECKVDSMHIFHHMEEGLDLQELKLYGAISYWKNREMHLYSFTANSLAIAETNDGFIWLSNEDHLKKLLALLNIKADVWSLAADKGARFGVVC